MRSGIPLVAGDPLTAGRCEVRLAGGTCAGLRTDSFALARSCRSSVAGVRSAQSSFGVRVS